MRRTLVAAAAVVLAMLAAPGPVRALPAVKHVFVIVLENKDYDETFGPDSQAPYLSKQLLTQGQLLTQYYGIGHVSLDNYVAMVSGQAPNPVTQSDCLFFQDFVSLGGPDANGQFTGAGCVYPTAVPTLMSQMEAKGLTWKGYMEDMGTPCLHPPVTTPATQDPYQDATAESQYATRHNPFMYFHSVIDDANACAAKVRDLVDLPADLATEASTPNFTFITPDLCSDGHDTPCVDGRPGGLVSEDAFLQHWVPLITASPAFQKDGLLVITYDEAEPESDQSACCGEVPGPNSPLPGIGGPGGGRTGAVLVSPFVQPGSVNDTPYNHYSLLRSIEDVFALDHIGFAAADGLVAFGADVYNRTPPTPAPAVDAGRGAAGGALPPTGASTAAAGAAAVLVACWLVLRRVRAATPPTP